MFLPARIYFELRPDYVDPFWFLEPLIVIVFAGYLVLAWKRSRENRRRWHRNLCPECGYDVRMNAEVCPECGRPITRFAKHQTEITVDDDRV
jgi:hypothetical protein